MELKLTRRRFGQLAIASAATAAIANLANKTEAQTTPNTNLVIYGARPEPKAGRVVVQSLNVTTGEVQDVTTATLEIGEQLTGFTSLPDGTLILAISPVRGGKKENNAPRLVFLGTSPKTLTVSGLTKQQLLESVLGTNDGKLIGLVIKSNYTPPISLVDINLQTGEISFTDRVILPGNERFSNLAQCQDGKIHTTAVGQKGDTRLVQLDLGQGKPIDLPELRFNDTVWNSGLNSLACSPANQLFALGKGRYEALYNLYTVNPSDGVMSLVKQNWEVAKITIVRP